MIFNNLHVIKIWAMFRSQDQARSTLSFKLAISLAILLLRAIAKI